MRNVLFFMLSVFIVPSALFASGRVFLVGVGPGDPDLASVRAVRVMKKTDVFLFCEPDIKARFKRYMKGKDVIKVPLFLWKYRGIRDPSMCPKASDDCKMIVQERNRVVRRIKDYAEKGKTVSILSDGDPLIYGPWSWIVDYFPNVVVIPGMSCFDAALSAIKRDLTYSPTTKSIILTADDWPGKTDTIKKLSRIGAPMVIFTMGLDFRDLIGKLKMVWPEDTPVAVVLFAGYREKESVVKGTLGNIERKVKGKLPFQHLVIVGKTIE